MAAHAPIETINPETLVSDVPPPEGNLTDFEIVTYYADQVGIKAQLLSRIPEVFLNSTRRPANAMSFEIRGHHENNCNRLQLQICHVTRRVFPTGVLLKLSIEGLPLSQPYRELLMRIENAT